MVKRCTSIGLMSVRNNDGIQDGRQNYSGVMAKNPLLHSSR